MRTTLSLDDDVAAELERLRKQRHLPLKTVVNDLLRLGLSQRRSAKKQPRFETRVADLGTLLLGDLDDVSGALALAEGEDFQ